MMGLFPSLCYDWCSWSTGNGNVLFLFCLVISSVTLRSTILFIIDSFNNCKIICKAISDFWDLISSSDQNDYYKTAKTTEKPLINELIEDRDRIIIHTVSDHWSKTCREVLVHIDYQCWDNSSLDVAYGLIQNQISLWRTLPQHVGGGRGKQQDRYACTWFGEKGDAELKGWKEGWQDEWRSIGTDEGATIKERKREKESININKLNKYTVAIQFLILSRCSITFSKVVYYKLPAFTLNPLGKIPQMFQKWWLVAK